MSDETSACFYINVVRRKRMTFSIENLSRFALTPTTKLLTLKVIKQINKKAIAHARSNKGFATSFYALILMNQT